MRFLWVAVFGMALASLVSAGPLPRPSVRLHQVDVVLMQAELGAYSEGKLALTPLEVLHSERPVDLAAPLVLRAPPWIAEYIVLKQRLLVGYVALVRDRSKPDKSYMADRNGPALLNDLGLEPALLPDRPELRAWLARQKRKDPFTEAQRKQLLAWLDDADPQLRQFAVGELALGEHPDLAPATRRALLKFAADADAPVGARALVLEVAWRAREHYPRTELYKLAASLLAQLPIQYRNDGRTEASVLANMAFEVLHDRPDVPARARWLRSNVAPLAEIAYLQLKRHQPEQAARALEHTLKQTLLAPNTRTQLSVYTQAAGSR